MSARLVTYALLSALGASFVTSTARAQAPVDPAAPVAPAAGLPANPAAPNNAAAGVLPPQGDPQVLDQGPIHEAFADPIALDAKPRMIVQQEPPEPINELAPEVKPEGENVEWIPGYWMWSDEQLNYVWVSGVWRDIPPGRRWVPGHWLQEGDSWVWVSGFWAGADWREVQMLPHPPVTIEAGPSSPAPGDNFFWVPGCWIWSDGGYAWRAGYWYAGQPNWVWVPDHYSYTPAGSIFVNGYWDRPLWNRGRLFAPVWWPAQRFGFPGFYTPRYVVNSSLLLASLFVNTRHNSYWFGHGGWANRGFYRPWWDNRGGRWNDPIWAYHRWHDGHRHDWDNHWRGQFDRRHPHWNGDLAGRPGGGRPGNGGPGNGGPGNGGPGNGGGRPGRGDGVSTSERLVQDSSNLSRGAVRLTNAQRENLGYRAPEWQQLRTARARVETGAGAGALGQTAGVGGAMSTTRGGPRGGMRTSFSLPPTAEGTATTGAATGAGVASGQSFERRAAYRPGQRLAGSNVGAVGGGNSTVPGPQSGSPWGGRRPFQPGGSSTTGGGATTGGGSVSGGATGGSGQAGWPGFQRRVQGGTQPPQSGSIAPGGAASGGVPGQSSMNYRTLPRGRSGNNAGATGTGSPSWGGRAWVPGGRAQFDGSGATGGGRGGTSTQSGPIYRTLPSGGERPSGGGGQPAGGSFRPQGRGNFGGSGAGGATGGGAAWSGGGWGRGGGSNFGGNAGGGATFRSSPGGDGGGASATRGGWSGGGSGFRGGNVGGGGGGGHSFNSGGGGGGGGRSFGGGGGGVPGGGSFRGGGGGGGGAGGGRRGR